MSSMFWFLIALGGAIVGSLLNVVIYRLPQQLLNPEAQLNLALPRSHCPTCRHPLGAAELIPLISYLWQRGRCRHCQATINPQYPLVELAAALWALAVVATLWWLSPSTNSFEAGGLTSLESLIFGGLGEHALTFSLKNVLMWLAFGYFLLALAVIDAHHQFLPDNLTLSFLWLGLLFNLPAGWVTLSQAVLGAVFGYLFLWGIYWLYWLWRRREGLGYGDFKLLAAIGAWVGVGALPSVLLAASVLGVAWGGIALLRGRHQAGTPLAFAPFLCSAAVVVPFYLLSPLGGLGR